MTKETIASTDWSFWISMIALAFSAASLYFSAVRSNVAKAQEKRRLPCLAVELVHGQFQNSTDNNIRQYAFKLLVRNGADSGNSIASATLTITYLTETHSQLRMKLLSADKPTPELLIQSGQQLDVPTKIESYNSVSGWLYFHASLEMLRTNRIESYLITVVDAHGRTYSVSEPFLTEVHDDKT